MLYLIVLAQVKWAHIISKVVWTLRGWWNFFQIYFCQWGSSVGKALASMRGDLSSASRTLVLRVHRVLWVILHVPHTHYTAECMLTHTLTQTKINSLKLGAKSSVVEDYQAVCIVLDSFSSFIRRYFSWLWEVDLGFSLILSLLFYKFLEGKFILLKFQWKYFLLGPHLTLCHIPIHHFYICFLVSGFKWSDKNWVTLAKLGIFWFLPH